MKVGPKSNFWLMGKVDVEPARCFLLKYPELFDEITFRQDHELSPHKDTKTIYLRWPREYTVHAALHSPEAVDTKYMRLNPLKDLVQQVELLLGMTAKRGIIVNLLEGGYISPHIDQGSHADTTDRFHVPIETNPACIMSSGNMAVKMDMGEVWYFDKHQLHSAVNRGSTTRIHLIMDFERCSPLLGN